MTNHLKPIAIDKEGEKWLRSDIDKAVIKEIKYSDYFTRGAKQMENDVEKATELTETAITNFSKSLQRYMELQNKFAEQSKKSSGSVRDAADKLSAGLARIEKAANFDRLERYVVLLERAAVAMDSLAALEASGKLEKIVSAIR